MKWTFIKKVITSKKCLSSLLILLISHPLLASEIKVTLLGTGTPVPDLLALGTSTAVEVNGQTLIFDAGRGMTIKMQEKSIPMGTVDAVFLTHHHSDHINGLGDLLLTGWLSFPGAQRSTPLKLIGPPGVENIAKGLALVYQEDINIRINSNSLSPKGAQLEPVTFSEEGVVWDKDGVKVTAFMVDHGTEFEYAFGYRIDYNDMLVVIAGDTNYNTNVIKNAKNADLLIHPVFAVNENIAKTQRGIKIASHHTSPEDAGKVFSQTKPRLAVFTHIALLPPDPPTRDDIIKRTARHYKGDFEMGSDGMVITVTKKDISFKR